MEGSEGSPPQSLCMIRAAELFPKPQMEKEDSDLTVPFQELSGESVKYLGRTDDGVLALSNYRLFLLKDSTNSETSVPLGLIESAQLRDLFHLIINCKDASTVKCSFETAEQCSEWQRRIQLSVGVPETLESLFAFPFYSWTCDNTHTSMQNGSLNGYGSGASAGAGAGAGAMADNLSALPLCLQPDSAERLQRASRYEDNFKREVERLGFDLVGSWRISLANEDFKLCPSYPQKILVPFCIPDEMLHGVANFRGSRRLPAVVWRHRKSGAVIARCSQPEVGWLGWRNAKDEQLLKALADACAFDRGEQQRRLTHNTTSGQIIPSSESSPTSPDGSHEEVPLDEVRKVLIVDARSYTSAVTNRARGGGCECIEYYPSAEIEFMNLGNIHVIRKSFQALRQLCASPPDIPNWLGLLEKTMWLQHLSGLLAASMTVCHAIEKKGRPVLVHCSDGWDRTPQIVATAQLCLDPYYRTVEGFRILVEREWLSYGHKFSDRCGHGPGSDELNERCPVFLQWLDLVHQIHKQFPCSFEFSMGYLIKLAQHSLSCLFGTFLCNTLKERIENSVFERTFSVWPFLSGPMYRNPLYIANKEKVLWPAHNVRDLYLWTEVYLGSLGNKNGIEFSSSNVEGLNGSISPMAKTRSYGDLISAGLLQNGMSRRSSDPNMSVDPNLMVSSESENNSIADLQTESSPDIIANLIHDTTRKLQDLTTELNNHDEENFKCSQQKYKQEPNESNSNDSQLSLDYEETVQKLLQQQKKQQQEDEQPQNDFSLKYPNETTTTPDCTHTTYGTTLFSSRPIGNNINYNNCEQYKTTPTTTITAPSPINSTRSGDYSHTGQAALNGSESVQREQENAGGAAFHKAMDMNLDLMQSVNLGESPSNTPVTILNGLAEAANDNCSDIQVENMWHGSVNTSTDTLVPMEQRQHSQQSSIIVDDNQDLNSTCCDINVDESIAVSLKNGLGTMTSTKEEQKSTLKSMTGSGGGGGVGIATNCNILPKVHGNSNGVGSHRSNSNITLSKSSSNAAISSSMAVSCLNSATQQSTNNANLIDSSANTAQPADTSALQTTATAAAAAANLNCNPMDESIMILPEHQKLEILFSGKCETVPSGDEPSVATPIVSAGCTKTTSTPSFYPYAAHSVGCATGGGITAHRRRRTSSSNSRHDAFTVKQQTNGSSTISRISLPSARSLPMTPPGLPERPQIAISCPDGLAHALSEQNIRLQQIVHEHKLREDVLLREIHDMRMALLKKTCPSCNNAAASNDEQVDEFFHTNRTELDRVCCYCWCSSCRTCNNKCKEKRRRRHHRRRLHYYRRSTGNANGKSYGDGNGVGGGGDGDDDDDDGGDDDDDDADNNCEDFDFDDDSISPISACLTLDNVENSSICSWEAVEDRSAPSSCTSSSIQPNATSVLWVPDHAVSSCTSCQTEFWLGRRKHHCRSCGQIFCAECSEFWAPLPDEKLFSPVRLCGPCYHVVTTRMQVSHFPHNPLLQLQQTITKSAATNAVQTVSAVVTPTAAAAATTKA